MSDAKNPEQRSPIGELLCYHRLKPHVGRPLEDPTPAAVYAKMERGTPYSPPELAEEWGVTRHTMLSRLESLHEDGYLRQKKFGSTTVFWKDQE